jgi:hypothetical protein
MSGTCDAVGICMPQINFTDTSNSQSVMPGCIRSRSVQDPDRGDHYALQ